MKTRSSHHPLLLVLLLLSIAIDPARCSEPLPSGSSAITVDTGAEPITVFTHKPAGYAGGPLLLVLHGQNRNAEEYRNWAITLATQMNVIVAAPLFDKTRFSNAAYNRGGILDDKNQAQPREKWTYTKLDKIIGDIRAREGRPDLAYSCIGHSGGGQFLVRFAAFHPEGATRIVAANPGSLVFPRHDWKFGYGFGGLPDELSNDAAMQHYLAAPLTLYLGTGDTDTTEDSLDKTPEALLQGRFRLERGRACFEFARKLAEEKGWPFHWRKIETEGIGHEAKRMFEAKEAIEALTGAK